MDARTNFLPQPEEKEKPAIPCGTTGFVELLSRFELETSSLPKAQKSPFQEKTTRKIKNWRTIQLLQCQEIAAGGPGLLFFMPSNGFQSPTSSPCPAGHTSEAIPTGTAFQGFNRPSAGDCTERTHLWPRLASRHRQPPACPVVAGHPGADRQQRHFNNK